VEAKAVTLGRTVQITHGKHATDYGKITNVEYDDHNEQLLYTIRLTDGFVTKRVEEFETVDPLRPVQGIVRGFMLSLGIWTVAGLLTYLIFRLLF